MSTKDHASALRPTTTSTQRFQKVTQRIISRSSRATAARSRCGVAPVSQSSNDTSMQNNSCINLGTQPDDGGNRRFSHQSASSMSNRSLASSEDGTNRPSSSTTNRSLASSRNRVVDRAAIVSNHDGPSASRRSSTLSYRSSTPHQSANHQSVMPRASSNGKSTSEKPAHTSNGRTSTQIQVVSSKTAENTKGRIDQTEILSSGPLRYKSSQVELCKDCKASILESVCFINNDGRIAAARTGAVYARNLHHCRKPGCAANQGQHPSSASTLSKNALVSKSHMRPTRQQPVKVKSHNSALVRHSLHPNSSTSIQASDQKSKNLSQIDKRSMSTVISLDGDGEAPPTPDTDTSSRRSLSRRHIGVLNSSPCGNEEVVNGLPCAGEQSCSQTTCQNAENQQSNEDHVAHVECNTPAASCISLDTHDGNNENNDEVGSVNLDVIDTETHDFKSFCYHGDNEYSCSEDGTDATTTPNSLIKGAFDNPSSLDVEEHLEVNGSRPRKSSVAWMRQRYLESLREQEAETVRLRKQEIMARKQAEDWMLDCHMEELLHKLAPNGEARVKVLVEAFETVIHCSDSESSQQAH